MAHFKLSCVSGFLLLDVLLICLAAIARMVFFMYLLIYLFYNTANPKLDSVEEGKLKSPRYVQTGANTLYCSQ